MVSPQAVLIAICVALTFYVGEAAVTGLKWVGHEGKVAGTKIVHALQSIPHPHRHVVDEAPLDTVQPKET
jgi:hypothetical protein